MIFAMQRIVFYVIYNNCTHIAQRKQKNVATMAVYEKDVPQIIEKRPLIYQNSMVLGG